MSWTNVAPSRAALAKKEVPYFEEIPYITFYRAFQSVVFISGQKMALRAFYSIRALTKALTYYYINCSQRHLLAAIENNWLGVPIEDDFQKIWMTLLSGTLDSGSRHGDTIISHAIPTSLSCLCCHTSKHWVSQN